MLATYMRRMRYNNNLEIRIAGSSVITSSFKRESVFLFFVYLQIYFTFVLDPSFHASIWICMNDDVCNLSR